MKTIEWQKGITKSTTTGLNMAWEIAGPTDGEQILMIAGLGCQLTMWHDEFCAPLLELGYCLIRFDNRDIGLTDEHPNPTPINMTTTFVRNKLGLKTPSNYQLETLADDTIGLIDALKLEKPHLLGVSMGGMVAQIVAAKFPEKIGKLITLMSSTNNPWLPMPAPHVLRALFLKKPKSERMEDVVNHVVHVFTAIGSPGYRPDPGQLRDRAKRAYLRAYKPDGLLRQTHGVVATGSIEHHTRKIQVPTCVIHGSNDPLLKRACAERINKLVPHATLHMVPGLGHDLPAALAPTFTTIIHKHLAQKNG